MTNERRICIEGLRGGVGATSIAAMLADSLRRLGQRVLAVDLNREDMLRLHFNIPYGDAHGWMAGAAPDVLHTETFRVDENLWVLPFGRNTPGSLEKSPLEIEAIWQTVQMTALNAQGGPRFDWIIYDPPLGRDAFANVRHDSDLRFLVTQPDMAAHILLGQYQPKRDTHILINNTRPMVSVNESVVIDWSVRYGSLLLPVRVHYDTYVQEALANMMPATTWYPQSSAARSLESLALWCLTSRGSGG